MTSVGRVLRRDAVASAFFLMLATGKVFLLSDWLFMFWISYLYEIQNPNDVTPPISKRSHQSTVRAYQGPPPPKRLMGEFWHVVLPRMRRAMFPTKQNCDRYNQAVLNTLEKKLPMPADESLPKADTSRADESVGDVVARERANAPNRQGLPRESAPPCPWT